MADLAYTFHWSPSEMGAMDMAELLQWHGQIERIGKDIQRQRS